MKTCKLWVSFMLAAALLLPAGYAFSQGRMADIQDAKNLLASNPTVNNRSRLATLQYLQGVDDLKASDLKGAVDMMQSSVWTFEDSKGQIPETNATFEEARYGLAYALLQNQQPFEAVNVVDKAVKADPSFAKAQYLLGAALMATSSADNTQRALDVWANLAKNGGAPYNANAAHAATRLGYDLSTLDHARGDSTAAATLLGNTLQSVGPGQGADDAENHLVQFAEGIYSRDSGDTMGAVDHLEALYDNDPTFELSSGVTLKAVLSNAYYAGGLEQLQEGGEYSQRTALSLFDNALKVGDPDALDAHQGKAIAYTKLNELGKAADELKIIFQKDPSLYNRIKQ